MSRVYSCFRLMTDWDDSEDGWMDIIIVFIVITVIVVVVIIIMHRLESDQWVVIRW